jgi:hypothetical protein
MVQTEIFCLSPAIYDSFSHRWVNQEKVNTSNRLTRHSLYFWNIRHAQRSNAPHSNVVSSVKSMLSILPVNRGIVFKLSSVQSYF